jgi:hypothetical protein
MVLDLSICISKLQQLNEFSIAIPSVGIIIKK